MIPHHLQQRIEHDLHQREADRMRRDLRAVDRAGLWVRRHGEEQTLLNLASNDYLGLANHPRLAGAVASAAKDMGTGATASRLVVGHTQQHADLEQRFATFKHAEAALIFPTGYMANLATLTALTRPGDLILLDKLSHASIIDAARASPAELRTFAHLNYDQLEHRLQRFAEKRSSIAVEQAKKKSDSPASTPTVFIATDSVFSMDGDMADVPRLVELAQRYEALLIVDEAHGTGVLGDTGSGLCEAQGVADDVDVVISTASKAMGSLGGIITASAILIDALINHARSLIYTTAVPPPQLASIDAALDIIRDEPARRQRLAELSQTTYQHLREAGWLIADRHVHTPIFPLIVGDTARALHAAKHLEHHGILGVAIRPPTVAPGTSRIRLSLRADMTDHDLEHLLLVLDKMTV